MSNGAFGVRRDPILCCKALLLAALGSSTPVITAQAEPRWEFNTFASGGFVPAYQIHSPEIRFDEQLDLYSAGFAVGRVITKPYGLGVIGGRGEALIEAMPFWLAYYPKQVNLTYFNNGIPPTPTGHGGPYSIHGASVTPLLLRWDLARSDRARIMPWAEVGGGLLWTNHKFPLLSFSTSVINFTPQAGAGVNSFTRQHQSVSLGLKAVHISNAGLGDNNPGLNVTLQFVAGYSWWK